MLESPDIRDRGHLSHRDIVGLNFIRQDPPFVFRRHYREGLRSHIFEVHSRESIRREQEGVLQDGLLVFPRSVPRFMLRLFRHRFQDLPEALAEITRFQLLQTYLPRRSFAGSSEFLVDYRLGGAGNILLCGLQEYVPGEIFDPWAYERSPETLPALLEHLLAVHRPPLSFDEYARAFAEHVYAFVQGVKRLIVRAGYIPDLSGVGNLILTPSGRLRLVDINNISPVSYSGEIFLDDKGYPVCDKSVEVLAILEKRLLCTEVPPSDSLYEVFLNPERMDRVRELEQRFRRQVRERLAESA